MGLARFAVSPIPSAQLFVASGLVELSLVPLVLVFVAGRLVRYTIQTAAHRSSPRTTDPAVVVTVSV